MSKQVVQASTLVVACTFILQKTSRQRDNHDKSICQEVGFNNNLKHDHSFFDMEINLVLLLVLWKA